MKASHILMPSSIHKHLMYHHPLIKKRLHLNNNCGNIRHQQKNGRSKKKVKEKEKEKKGVEQVNYRVEEITFQADEEHYNFNTFDACNANVNDN